MPRAATRHTIYDVLDQKGFFDSNPANQFAIGAERQSIYERQAFPTMVYHPKGLRVVYEPGTTEITPWGPERRGEQKQLVSKTAANQAELTALLAAGWHLHPADSMAAGGEEAKPPVSETVGQTQGLEAELAALRAKMAEMEKLLAGHELVNLVLPLGADGTPLA